jgi:hypothetical protein
MFYKNIKSHLWVMKCDIVKLLYPPLSPVGCNLKPSIGPPMNLELIISLYLVLVVKADLKLLE